MRYRSIAGAKLRRIFGACNVIAIIIISCSSCNLTDMVENVNIVNRQLGGICCYDNEMLMNVKMKFLSLSPPYI